MAWILSFLIVALFTLYLYTSALQVKFAFDSKTSDMNLTLLGLNSLLKALLTLEESKLMLKVYLFNRKVYEKLIKPKKNKPNGLDLLKMYKPQDVHVNAYYGFTDPFNTGIACGAINVASQFINIDSLNHNPDFTSDDDYIYIDATAKLNMGSTFINTLKFQSQ